jgi:hypothetical protein
MMNIDDLEKAVESNRHKKAPFEKKFTDWTASSVSRQRVSAASLQSSYAISTASGTHRGTTSSANMSNGTSGLKDGQVDEQVDEFTRVIRLRSGIIGAQLSTLLKEAERSSSSMSSVHSKRAPPSHIRKTTASTTELMSEAETYSGGSGEEEEGEEGTAMQKAHKAPARGGIRASEPKLHYPSLSARLQEDLAANPLLATHGTEHEYWEKTYGSPLFVAWVNTMCGDRDTVGNGTHTADILRNATNTLNGRGHELVATHTSSDGILSEM